MIRERADMAEGSDDRRALVRYAIFIAAIKLSALFLLWTVSDALLLIFAGVVFAAFLDAMTVLLGRVLPWGRSVRLASFVHSWPPT
jgi:hypothetical protein